MAGGLHGVFAVDCDCRDDTMPEFNVKLTVVIDDLLLSPKGLNNSVAKG